MLEQTRKIRQEDHEWHKHKNQDPCHDRILVFPKKIWWVMGGCGGSLTRYGNSGVKKIPVAERTITIQGEIV